MNEYAKNLSRNLALLTDGRGVEEYVGLVRQLESALAQARAEALEEAAICVERGRESHNRNDHAERIRTLSTTPPASIPVAKVREVLSVLFEESDSYGERYALAQVMDRLGVSIDGGVTP